MVVLHIMNGMNVIRSFLIIAIICTFTSCSGQPGQEDVHDAWAVEPTYKSAAQFSNHAGFVINHQNEVFFIDSGSNMLYKELCISPEYYLRNYDPDLLMF